VPHNGTRRNPAQAFTKDFIEQLQTARRLGQSMARGLITKQEANAQLQTEQYPLGSAARCQIAWALTDSAEHTALQAAIGHYRIRRLAWDAMRQRWPLQKIIDHAEEIERQCNLLQGEARALLEQAAWKFMQGKKR